MSDQLWIHQHGHVDLVFGQKLFLPRISPILSHLSHKQAHQFSQTTSNRKRSKHGQSGRDKNMFTQKLIKVNEWMNSHFRPWVVNPFPHTPVKQVYVYFFFKLSKSARLSENQSFTIVLGARRNLYNGQYWQIWSNIVNIWIQHWHCIGTGLSLNAKKVGFFGISDNHGVLQK